MADITITATASSVTAVGTRSLSALRSEVLKNLGSDNDYFTDDDIDYFIIKAFDNMAEECQSNMLEDTQTATPGTYLYDIPEEAIAIQDITYDNALLEKIEKKDMLKKFSSGHTPATVTGTPTQWCMYSLTQVMLYPTPDSADNIVMHYVGYPANLADDSDTSSFIRKADQVAAFYATAMLAARDTENTQFGIYYKLYKEAMNKFLMNQIKKPQHLSGSDIYDDGEDE